MIGWVTGGVNLFAVMFYLFAAFSLAEDIRTIEQLASYVSPDNKTQLENAYTLYNSRVPPMAALYGHTSEGIYQTGTKNDSADEFFRADTGRNQAYDIADDYKNIVQEDRPGEDDEINKQIRPVRKYPNVNEEPESWYKEYEKNRNDRKEDRKFDDRRPLARFTDRLRDRFRDRYDERPRGLREERVSHPFGYEHRQRGRYSDFY